MRQDLSDALIALYNRARDTGILDRPRVQRAFEGAYMAYKSLVEAGPINGLQTLVPSGSAAIDVGANIGFFTVRFARWVGPQGRVIAIEPEAHNIASLRRRVQRAGLAGVVECLAAAAADRPGELRLAITPGHPADHHLADTGVPVPAVTLDDIAGTQERPISLLKIDVQGAETMVLAGARRLIETHRPAIFVEVDPASLARSGSSPEELVAALTSIGYQPRRLTRRGVGAAETAPGLIARAAGGYIDALFVPA
ncbi:MAG TPA: FkbM family methyltransferase [Solirubrobacteraceae bacterium]|jgi:FkbM family methyltransferase|nr:FkbM family methyltransferase [Solirubrobacteraceae bacterium]